MAMTIFCPQSPGPMGNLTSSRVSGEVPLTLATWSTRAGSASTPDRWVSRSGRSAAARLGPADRNVTSTGRADSGTA